MRRSTLTVLLVVTLGATLLWIGSRTSAVRDSETGVGGDTTPATNALRSVDSSGSSDIHPVLVSSEPLSPSFLQNPAGTQLDPDQAVSVLLRDRPWTWHSTLSRLDEALALAREYARHPDVLGPSLARALNAATSTTELTLLGMILMSSREYGEPLVIARFRKSTNMHERGHLINVLMSPKNMLPADGSDRDLWTAILIYHLTDDREDAASPRSGVEISKSDRGLPTFGSVHHPPFYVTERVVKMCEGNLEANPKDVMREFIEVTVYVIAVESGAPSAAMLVQRSVREKPENALPKIDVLMESLPRDESLALCRWLIGHAPPAGSAGLGGQSEEEAIIASRAVSAGVQGLVTLRAREAWPELKSLLEVNSFPIVTSQIVQEFIPAALTREEAGDTLAELIHRPPSVGVLGDAYTALAHFPGAAAERAALHGLASEDEEERAYAAGLAGSLGLRSTLPRLVEMARNPPNSSDGYFALDAIEKIDPDVYRSLNPPSSRSWSSSK